MYTEEQTDFLRRQRGVTEVEVSDAVAFMTDINYNGGTMPGYFFFSNADRPTPMNTIALAEGRAPETAGEICIPLIFKVGGGYKVGDNFVLTAGSARYTWEISGFTTEILHGNINDQVFQGYLSEDGYRRLEEELPESAFVSQRVRLENPEDSAVLERDFENRFLFAQDAVGADSLLVFGKSYPSAKNLRTFLSDITSIIILAVSAIIVFTSLIVVSFRIRNHIEESAVNIGVLKAAGYTGGQLVLSVMMQFFSISVVGIVSGIGLSYAFLPGVSAVLEQQTAMPWKQGFDPVCSALAGALIIAAVLLVSLISARRIGGLQPLTALRQGISAHNFTRNYLPLDRAKGGLSWLLAVKSALQSKRQVLMICVIVAVVSFAASAGVSVYDNLALHPENFGKLIVGEAPDAAIVTKTPEDTAKIHRELEKDGGVRKVFYYDNFDALCGDNRVSNIVVEDFSLMEGALLYEGRYPRHDNEVVISGALAELEHKKIGDSINMRRGSDSFDYLIVGFISVTQNYGVACGMTHEGAYRINRDYEPLGVYVYLEDASKTAGFVDEMKDSYGAGIASAIDVHELVEVQLGAYGQIFRVVAYAIIFVASLVIFFTLYLVLKTAIIQRRRELGIQKAMGFTTWQLMNRISLIYIPAIALGVAAGGIAGMLGFNSIFVALAKNTGIMNASMPVSVGMTAAVCAGLVGLAYIFAALISRRIRKISPCALISE
jgi:putative ABC transport system permease protein